MTPTLSTPDYQDQTKRVNRMKGQLDGILRMIADKRYCVDILQQTAAIHAALRALESTVLERHLRSCVRDALIEGGENAEQKMDELLRVYKKLEVSIALPDTCCSKPTEQSNEN